jgi:glucokinase
MELDLNIVVDIGGTNTRVGLCDGIELIRRSIRRYRNAEHSGIKSILMDFLSHNPGRPLAICIDMAGPVHNGVGTLTNLDWTVDSGAIKVTFGAQVVAVLNDLQAQGHAVPYFHSGSLSPVLLGREAEADATRLVINVGTGLNAALVIDAGGRTLVPAAEAGHITLQAIDDEEKHLRDWIGQRYASPGVEDILSGRGLERIYAWVCYDEGGGTLLQASEIMSKFAENEPRALRTVGIFVQFFGRYAGDLALIALPFGGIYLVGGVIRHLGPHLVRMGFAEAFADKGRFGPLVSQFSVHLVTDDYAALCGCACHLSEIRVIKQSASRRGTTS